MPPADTNIDLHRFHQSVTRIPNSKVFMRVESLYNSEYAESEDPKTATTKS
jgi:hypothetical protein